MSGWVGSVGTEEEEEVEQGRWRWRWRGADLWGPGVHYEQLRLNQIHSENRRAKGKFFFLYGYVPISHYDFLTQRV